MATCSKEMKKKIVDEIKEKFLYHRKYSLAKDKYTATSHDDFLSLSLTVRDMLIEKWMAFGYTNIRVVSPHRGIEIANGLRDEGYAVTEVSAQGRDGTVAILHCSILRRYENKIRSKIISLDSEAFITAENVYLVQHGFWN